MFNMGRRRTGTSTEFFRLNQHQIPPELRASAKIEITSESGYEGDHSPWIGVSYWRDETEDEAAERERELEQRRAKEDAEERRTYLRLAAKYGPR